MSRNLVSLDPISKGVSEQATMLSPGPPLLGNLFEARKREFFRPAIQSPVLVVGQILLSGMLYGGLLDWRALERLCQSVTSEIMPENGWLEFETSGSTDYPPVARRWHIDAHTARLWALASGLLGSLSFKDRRTNARAAITRYLGASVNVDALHVQACAWWRQKLPPVLAAHAEGEGPSQAVPLENWHRLLTGEKGRGAPPREDKVPMQRSSSPAPVFLTSAALQLDLSFIRAALKAASASTIAVASRSSTANTALQALPLQTPIARYLRDWFCECLTVGYDVSGRQRQKRRRTIMPSTLLRDLAQLKKVILPGLMQVGLNPADLIELYLSELPDDLRQDYLERSVTRIRRFHRWLVANAAYPWLQITLNSTGPQDSVWARLISETEYDRALGIANVNPSKPLRLKLRVALILGFRAGLRPQELRALQSGDFRLGADGMVLLVKPNRDNRLKTTNARRVLPLHLLLSPDEQADVARHSG